MVKWYILNNSKMKNKKYLSVLFVTVFFFAMMLQSCSTHYKTRRPKRGCGCGSFSLLEQTVQDDVELASSEE